MNMEKLELMISTYIDLKLLLLCIVVFLLIVVIKQSFTIKKLNLVKEYKTTSLNKYEPSFLLFFEEYIFNKNKVITFSTINFSDLKSFNNIEEEQQQMIIETIIEKINTIFNGKKIYLIVDGYQNIQLIDLSTNNKEKIIENNNKIIEEVYTNGLEINGITKHFDIYIGTSIKNSQNFNEMKTESEICSQNAKKSEIRTCIFQDLTY